MEFLLLIMTFLVGAALGPLFKRRKNLNAAEASCLTYLVTWGCIVLLGVLAPPDRPLLGKLFLGCYFGAIFALPAAIGSYIFIRTFPDAPRG